MNANRLGILVVVSAIAAQTLLLQSCSSFLEEYSQDNDYVRTWNDLDELLIGNCYMPVVEGEAFSAQANYGSFLHYLADELEENNTPYMGEAAAYDDSRSWAFGYFTWQQRVGQNNTYTDFYQENKTWTKVYNLINVANNIIESVNDVPSSTDEEQQGVHKVRGEAHFLRAFYYFWLANIYGQPYNPATAAADLAVPLKTSEAVEDIKFSRASVQTVYDQVVRDLQTAETELAQVRAKQTSLYRADVTAVRLLFSRVYLYLQQWEQAATYAAKVIEAHPQLQDIVATTTAKFAVASNPENLFSMGGDDAPCLCYYGYRSFRGQQIHQPRSCKQELLQRCLLRRLSWCAVARVVAVPAALRRGVPQPRRGGSLSRAQRAGTTGAERPAQQTLQCRRNAVRTHPGRPHHSHPA